MCGSIENLEKKTKFHKYYLIYFIEYPITFETNFV